MFTTGFTSYNLRGQLGTSLAANAWHPRPLGNHHIYVAGARMDLR